MISPAPEMTAVTRLVIYVATASLIGYDVCAMLFGWATISQQVRWLDLQCGGLFRYFWLALWAHWFIPLWRGPNSI